MAIAKSTWFFTQFQNGWSLSLWKNFAAGQLDRAQGTALAIAPKLAALTGKQTILTVVRTSDEAVTGDSILQEANITGNQQQDSEDPTTALLVKMQIQDRSRKKLIFLRGIWDSLVVLGGKKNAQAAWDQAFTDFGEAVRLNGYGWLGNSVTTTANITGYVVNPVDGTVAFALDANMFALGDVNQRRSVRISGLNNSKSILIGQQVVIVTAQNACKTVKGFAAGPFSGIGKMRFSTKALFQHQFMEATRIGERKVGAPFLHQRGRRSARPVR